MYIGLYVYLLIYLYKPIYKIYTQFYLFSLIFIGKLFLFSVYGLYMI